MTKPSNILTTIPRLSLNRMELAASIGVSPNTIDQMVKEGNLPPARRWNTRKLWIISEVAVYISEWPVDGRTGARLPPEDDDDWRAS